MNKKPFISSIWDFKNQGGWLDSSFYVVGVAIGSGLFLFV